MSSPVDHAASTTHGFDLSKVADAIVTVSADRPYVIQGDGRLTYGEIIDRSRRLASYLHSRGLGCTTERPLLASHEVGQDLLGIYAYNGNEYLESMFGAFRARVAPFNVNYRYVANELHYLLQDSGAGALIYHAAFAPRIAEVLPRLPQLRVLIQIADASGNELLDGAVDYETMLEGTDIGPLPSTPSPDDLYVLYTGGTTGMPKGVLWRQHDAFVAAFGGRDLMTGAVVDTIDTVAERVSNAGESKMMLLPPLMHGAAQWGALTAFTTGQTLVFPANTDGFDADEVVDTIARERVSIVTVVGDAMARPLADAMRRRSADLSCLAVIANGGATLTPTAKHRLVELLPHVLVMDGVGSSETGAQLSHLSTNGAVSTGRFKPGPQTCVLNEDLTAVHEPGHDGLGWLAQRGSVPLGYKGDAAKTAATFPSVGGERYSIPGDRARHLDDGTIELLGRDSVTINSGGEKIFAEEVETALAAHPAVADVVVAGRPSTRWGHEVVAVVALADGATATVDELIDHTGTLLARYKLPKAIVFRDAIQRSPAGKADYRWARAQVAPG